MIFECVWLLVTTCKSGWSFDHIHVGIKLAPAWKCHGVTVWIAEYPNQSSHIQIHCTLNASILTTFHYFVFGTQQIREDLSLATSRNALVIVISNQNWSVDSVGEHSAAASGLPGYNLQIRTAIGQESGFETPNGIQMTCGWLRDSDCGWLRDSDCGWLWDSDCGWLRDSDVWTACSIEHWEEWSPPLLGWHNSCTPSMWPYLFVGLSIGMGLVGSLLHNSGLHVCNCTANGGAGPSTYIFPSHSWPAARTWTHGQSYLVACHPIPKLVS